MPDDAVCSLPTIHGLILTEHATMSSVLLDFLQIFSKFLYTKGRLLAVAEVDVCKSMNIKGI
jgi:hypothetical protein